MTFPAAEIQLEFLDPTDAGGAAAMFPTGRSVDELQIPGIGVLEATLINAGIPTVFLNAQDLGYKGTELQDDINQDPAAMRQHTPKIAFVAPPRDYVTSSGKHVAAGDVDLLVRALAMGKLHHAMMGTAAIAIGTAAAVPGTLVNLAADGGTPHAVRFGHPSGTLRVGAEAENKDGQWRVTKALMSRSARMLMEGFVCIPGDSF